PKLRRGYKLNTTKVWSFIAARPTSITILQVSLQLNSTNNMSPHSANLLRNWFNTSCLPLAMTAVLWSIGGCSRAHVEDGGKDVKCYVWGVAYSPEGETLAVGRVVRQRDV